jgi:hypothetical protein
MHLYREAMCVCVCVCEKTTNNHRKDMNSGVNTEATTTSINIHLPSKDCNEVMDLDKIQQHLEYEEKKDEILHGSKSMQ